MLDPLSDKRPVVACNPNPITKINKGKIYKINRKSNGYSLNADNNRWITGGRRNKIINPFLPFFINDTIPKKRNSIINVAPISEKGNNALLIFEVFVDKKA